MVKAVRALGSGILVYLGMAACSAATDSPAAIPSGADGGPSGVAQGVLNPVPTASAAAPAALAISTETCTASGTYIEHAYPGAAAIDLASSVVAFMTPVGTGYQYHGPWPISVKDGAVAIDCTSAPGATITFIRR